MIVLTAPGGGVCCFIPVIFKAHSIEFNSENQKLLNSSNCEIVLVDLFTGRHKLRIMTIYRPPKPQKGTDVLAQTGATIEFITNVLTACNHPIIILGDFNLPDIDWPSNTARSDGVHDAFLTCFNTFGLTQFVNQPTRINLSGKDNILDIILSNDCLLINSVDCIPPLGTSDHNIVGFQIEMQNDSDMYTNSSVYENNSPIKMYKYNWSKADFDNINAQLANIDWHSLLGYHFDTDMLWHNFKLILWPIIDSYTPKILSNPTLKYKCRNYPRHIRTLLNRKKAYLVQNAHEQNT